MEIKYEVTEKLNFSLDNTKITGIATTSKDETIEVLSLENSDKVELYINNNKQEFKTNTMTSSYLHKQEK